MQVTETRRAAREPRIHRQIHFVRDGSDLARVAAEELVSAIEEAVVRRGLATVALSGGATPGSVYEILASEPFTTRMHDLWRRVHVFWTDERHVSPDHPDSAYRMAHWALLGRIPIPSVNVHRVRAEMADAGDAAAAYHHEMRTFFVPRGLVRDGYPSFDVVLLGLDDRPGSGEALGPDVASGRWAVATFDPEAKRYEVGLTLAVLNNARRVFFLAQGADRAPMLRAVLEDRDDAATRPRRVRPSRGTVRWLVDAEAGSLLRFDS
jgi:6-phosphogluconolactonase